MTQDNSSNEKQQYQYRDGFGDPLPRCGDKSCAGCLECFFPPDISLERALSLLEATHRDNLEEGIRWLKSWHPDAQNTS